VAGFVAGILGSALNSHFTALAPQRHAPVDEVFLFFAKHRFFSVLVGFASLLFLVSERPPGRPKVFTVSLCFFAGCVLGAFVTAVAASLARF
jgi:hypothetical protein